MNRTLLAVGLTLAAFGCTHTVSGAITLSGSLGAAGEVDFHNFTLNLDATAGAGRQLVINTVGTSLSPDNDPEIGLYTPGGTLVANDDDDGLGQQSQLTFGLGGSDGDLAAGGYGIALGGFDTTFANGPTVVSTSSNTGPYAINLALLGTTTSVLGSGVLDSGEVEFFPFTLVDPILASNWGRLVIDTIGSTLAPSNDTELGLFDAAGLLLATDDDDGPGFLSELSFGFGGNDGDLAAGTYRVYIGGFNTTFGNGPTVTSDSPNTGGFVINFRESREIPGGVTAVSSVPEPSTLALFGPGLVGIALLVRRRKQS